MYYHFAESRIIVVKIESTKSYVTKKTYFRGMFILIFSMLTVASYYVWLCLPATQKEKVIFKRTLRKTYIDGFTSFNAHIIRGSKPINI